MGTPDVTKASDEELTQMLSGSYSIDEVEEETAEEDESEEDSASEEAEDSSEEDDSDDEAEDSDDEDDSEEADEEDEEEPIEVKTLREENERLAKQIQAKEQMIQRQGNELGELRQIKRDLLTAIQDKKREVEELEGVDTTAWYKEQKNLEQLENRYGQIAKREEVITHSARAVEIADKIAPPFEGMNEAITSILKRDGETDEGIRAFLENPGILGNAAPQFLIQVRKRAYAEKLLTQAYEALKQVNAASKKEKPSAPPVKRRIKSTDAAGSVGRPPKVTREDMTKMSTKDLEKILAKTRRA